MEGYSNFHGITLKKDEVIETTAALSTRCLIFTWASIPCGLLLFWIVVYLPNIIRMALSSAFKSAVMHALGADNSASIDIGDYIFRNVPDFLMGVFGFTLFLLIAAWLIWCLVMTWHHTRNSLTITNFRVIGKAGDEEMDSPLNEIKNVFIEQSLWGKLLNFGSIVVSTKRRSLTFRNIDDPERIYNELLAHAEDYCAS